MTRLTATVQPVALISIPQGTYAGAQIKMSSASGTYLDPVTKSLVQKMIAGPLIVSIPFSSAITVGSTLYVFNFDLDLSRLCRWMVVPGNSSLRLPSTLQPHYRVPA